MNHSRLTRRLPVILLVMLSLIPLSAWASIFAGTWTISVTAWNTTNFPNDGHPPPPPINAAVTFAFDDTTTAIHVPISQFSSNFGVTSVEYSLNIFAPQIRPDLYEVIFMYHIGPSALEFAYEQPQRSFTTPVWFDVFSEGGASMFAATYTGTAPARTNPEPATASLVALGAAVLGFALRQQKRA